MKIEAADRGNCRPPHRFPIDEISWSWFPGDKNVFRNRHVGHQVEFLVDGDNALLLSFGRRL